MNKVVLIGRLTRDPASQGFTQNGETKYVTRYTLAVDRRYKKDGEAAADFISCVAFGRQAEFANKWFRKGTKIAIAGRIQTGSYTNKDGQKVYSSDIIVEEQEFAESKASSNNEAEPPAPAPIGDGWMNIPDGIDEELPFN